MVNWKTHGTGPDLLSPAKINMHTDISGGVGDCAGLVDTVLTGVPHHPQASHLHLAVSCTNIPGGLRDPCPTKVA